MKSKQNYRDKQTNDNNDNIDANKFQMKNNKKTTIEKRTQSSGAKQLCKSSVRIFRLFFA